MNTETRVIKEHKIIELDSGSVTLVTKLNDGTAHVIENINMQTAIDYIACYENLERIQLQGAS